MKKITKDFNKDIYLFSNTANYLINEKKLSKETQYNPSKDIIENLKYLHDNIIIKCLENLKGEIYITSGYRCDIVNQFIGGSKNSQHTKGMAVDIVYFENEKKNNKKLFDFLKNLEFDQLIWENNGNWIHVSFNIKKNRKQIISL